VQTGLFGVAIVGTTVLLALLAMAVVRRSTVFAALEAHTEVAGFVYAVLGVIYAVILAFVVIAVWEEFEKAELYVELESNALADLYRLGEGLPGSDREGVQATLLAYVQAVRGQEWETMSRGEPGARAEILSDELWRAYRNFEPSTERETALLNASLSRLTEFSDARRLRLHESQNVLPGLLWGMLFVGGIITVGFSFLFGVRSARSQAVITVLLSATVALLLFLVYAIDRPFQGDLRVGSDTFERVELEMVRVRGTSAP
jgi:hypothetical protein